MITHKIEALLRASDKPLTARQIGDALSISSNDASRFVDSLRRKYGDQLHRRKIDGKMQYTFDASKFEQRERIFTLPPDLNRGWRNPVTGYQPDRLGA